MEYRILPHGCERISVLGMGSSVIGAKPSGRRSAATVTPVPQGWTSRSSTSIMIWPSSVTSWQRSII